MHSPESSSFDVFKEKIDHLFSTSIELFKLKLVELLIPFILEYVKYLFVFWIFILTSLLLTIGLALWLGNLVGEIYYGFFLVGIAYFFLAIFIMKVSDRSVARIISRSFFKIMFKNG